MGSMNKHEPFAERLARLRDASGLSQAALADKASVPLGTLRNLEQGQRVNPRLTTLAALARALGMGIDELTGFKPAK